jgi:uncharacterized membrane protein YcaP (DUF421 family)
MIGLSRCQKKRLEKIINPKIVSLVTDGNMDKEKMKRTRIGIKVMNPFMRLG